jgi:hypothetical protein
MQTTAEPKLAKEDLHAFWMRSAARVAGEQCRVSDARTLKVLSEIRELYLQLARDTRRFSERVPRPFRA